MFANNEVDAIMPRHRRNESPKTRRARQTHYMREWRRRRSRHRREAEADAERRSATRHNNTTTPVQPSQEPAVVTESHRRREPRPEQQNGEAEESNGDGDEADGEPRDLNRDAFAAAETDFDEWSLHQILCHIASGNPIPSGFAIEKHPTPLRHIGNLLKQFSRIPLNGITAPTAGRGARMSRGRASPLTTARIATNLGLKKMALRSALFRKIMTWMPIRSMAIHFHIFPNRIQWNFN